MPKYVIKRLIMIVPIVIVVIFLLFIMLYSLPGSRMQNMPVYNGGDTLDSIFEFLNLGDNFFTKFVRYCYNIIFHLDFGPSSVIGRRMTVDLSLRVRSTFIILGCGVAATLAIGIPLGVFCAMRKNRLSDRIVNVVTLVFASIPNYSLAMIIVLILAVYLRLLSPIGYYTSPATYIMPTITIALGGISSIARTTRASMLEVLEQPYITALRSKGLKEKNVVYRHAFKNALVPVISVLGAFISQMFCGTFVVEHFFNIPGLGSLMLRAVSQREHFEVLGCTVVVAVILSATNIMCDILYAFVNPQIKLRYAKVRGGKLRKEAAE